MSPQDCTGCDLCTHACPDKCLTGKPLAAMQQQEVSTLRQQLRMDAEAAWYAAALALALPARPLPARLLARPAPSPTSHSPSHPSNMQGPNWDFYRSLPAR